MHNKTILIVVDSPKEWNEYYDFLCKGLHSLITWCSKLYGVIEANGCCIKIVRSEAKYFRDMRPDYHYAYGHVDDYLTYGGSKRLVDLASIEEIVNYTPPPNEKENVWDET